MTNKPTRCPQCDQPLTQVGQFWVCPEHGQVSLEKPSVPLRIFLSYGHDSNEELVRRIKADLEEHGHDVWIDKSEIKFGDDWRRSITEGIVGSHRVLSFLSKHSTRDPGVCLDEIGIALSVKGGNILSILVEREEEVSPPQTISHIQWLDMHDWKHAHGVVHTEEDKDGNAYSVGDAAWEQWYQANLAEIIRAVESDESRRFAGEIQTLAEHLKPIASDSRIATLLRKGFIGRKWLFEAIEQWRTAPAGTPSPLEGERAGVRGDSRLFWITGDPGVGKSALAAQLTHFGRDKVIAAQFVEWDKPEHRDARRVVRSLAFQLATRLPDYRKLLLTLPEIAELDRKDPPELFDCLLANPLKTVIGGGRARQLIVIDALDEAGEAGRNPLVEMLARHAPRLPDWLGLVVTSRPESAVKTPLQALNPFVLDTHTEANRADLREYLQRELASHLENRPDADRIVQEVLEKSEGVFLYAERFCHDVQCAHLSLDRPEQFPQGLGGIYFQYFQRQFPDMETFRRDVRPALRAILAAREPLPVEILQRLFHWQDEELRDFTRTLGSLFPVTKEANREVIKSYHKSLADWLGDESRAGAYFVSVTEGHRTLANLGWWQAAQTSQKAADYFVRHLVWHLRETQQYARLVALSVLIFRQWLEQSSDEQADLDALRRLSDVLEDPNAADNFWTAVITSKPDFACWNSKSGRQSEFEGGPRVERLIWTGFSSDASTQFLISNSEIWTRRFEDDAAFKPSGVLERIGIEGAALEFAGLSADGKIAYVCMHSSDDISEYYTVGSWALDGSGMDIINEFNMGYLPSDWWPAPSIPTRYHLGDLGVWSCVVVMKNRLDTSDESLSSTQTVIFQATYADGLTAAIAHHSL